jgi:xanthine dehydrogenase accessory factor
VGTIGGGAVELRAEKLALEALDARRSYTKAFMLRRNDVEDLGMICGGDVKFYLQYVAPTPEGESFVRSVAACLNRDADAWLLYDITDETVWQMGLYTPTDGLELMERADASDPPGLKALSPEQVKALMVPMPVQRQVAGRLVYSEPIVRAGRVVVFGGGHVAQELVPVLAHLGFPCVVYEDRPDFARPELFPGVGEVVLGDFGDITANIELRPSDYLVVMTRGHVSDFNVENQVLRLPSAYVGVVGSRSKIAAVTQRLLEAGVPRQAIDRVYTPIGLDIGAQTPAELAISVAAELIQVRAERAGEPRS